MAYDRISEFEEKKKRLIRKKKRTRVKKRFIVFILLLVCISAIFVVLKAPFFNVKTIVCEGNTTLSREEVIKIAGAKTNVNIFSTGVGTMERRLEEHPVIAECNVRRLFPNKIKIWVRESVPVIYVENNGALLLADKYGKIIKSVDGAAEDASKGKAKLSDFKPASVKIGECMFADGNASHMVILECVEILDSLGMIGNVTSILATDLSDIQLEYEDRLSIMLGGYEDMKYKLTFVKEVIENNLSKYEKAVLDYRGGKLYVGSKTEEIKPVQNPEDSQNDEAPENTETIESTENGSNSEETEN